MVYQYPSIAIQRAKDYLYNFGQVVKQEKWQSIKSPDSTVELLNHSFGFIIPESLEKLQEEVKPNLPWAEDHFKERVGGEPLNPPPSAFNWPFAMKKITGEHKGESKEFAEDHLKGGKFSHTYPERFWPKLANSSGIFGREGIRFKYGDYQDVKNLLYRDPTTRQAYLPIWFPEDTGVVHGERVPCTLGYHFIIRNSKIHVIYYIRSCDIIRHFRDDIYLACRLAFDISYDLLTRIVDAEYPTKEVIWFEPGTFTMHITSLHCFENERELLKNPKY